MKGVFALLMLALAAGAPAKGAQGGSMLRLSVTEVIERQRELVGMRFIISGRLSSCQPRSCTLHGTDSNGRDRFLSIGPNARFDEVVSRHAGRTIEVEARLTEICLPNVDPDLVPVCADRASTLVDPVFIRAL